MNPAIATWALRHHVSFLALEELRRIFTPEIDAPKMPESVAPLSEAAVQSLVRLEAVRKHMRLWRNNVGALKDERGVPVRYGLANDTKALNDTVKSGDLIGWRSIVIQPEHLGRTIAQFVSRECKHVGWRYTGADREPAQLRWAELVNASGGDAAFCTGEGTL